jgi:lipoprotein-anchoring transpeptidase ErfK/SrfK
MMNSDTHAQNREKTPVTPSFSTVLTRLFRYLLLGLLAFSGPPVFLALGSYVYFHTNDRILPGVILSDQDLSWKTIDEVELLVDERWNQDDRIAIIDLQDPERVWEDHASAFGLRVDAASTANDAYQQGRGGQGFQSILNLLQTLRNGAVVDYHVTVDAIVAKERLQAWAEIASIPALDASITLKGREIFFNQASEGKALDVLASLDMIITDPVSIRVDHKMIPLVMAEVPPVKLNTEGALNELERLVQTDAHLTAYDPVTDELLSWSPSDEEFQRWIGILLEGDTFQVEIQEEHIRSFLREINTSLGSERRVDLETGLAMIKDQFAGIGVQDQPLVMEYLPSSYVVQPEDNLVSISFKIGMPYWKLYETNPGLSSQGLVRGETLVVPPRNDMLELPVIPDRELLAEHVISTGIPSSPTLPGIFQVNSHFENAYASIWDLYMPHFLGIYDAVPGFTNGIHGLPLLSSGRRLWADVLGNPASYGCIILDLQAAEELFYWADEGVVVEIRE